jgi:hypothetical protein
MNLVQRPTLVELILRDASQEPTWILEKNKGQIQHWVNMSLGAAAIESYLAALAQRVEPLTDAEIVGATITYQYFATNALPAVAGNYNRHAAIFILSDATGDGFIVEIPAFKPAKLETSGQWAGIQVNQADPDVAALVNLLVNGNGTVSPVTHALNDLTTLDTAYHIIKSK